MKATTSARLSKGAHFARCGGCGNTIAEVHGSATPTFGPPLPISLRHVITLPGWIEVEGVWTTSTRAQGRYDRDRSLATRNPGTPDRLADDARQRLRQGKSARLRRTLPPPVHVRVGTPEGGALPRDTLPQYRLVIRTPEGEIVDVQELTSQLRIINADGWLIEIGNRTHLPRRAFARAELPVLARCPRCQRVNELGVQLLD